MVCNDNFFLSMSIKNLNFLSSHQCLVKNFLVVSRRKSIKNGFRECRDLSTNSNSLLSPSHILSKTTRENFVNNLNALKPIDAKVTPEIKKAAVLVPLCEYNKQMVVLYTVRAMHLKANGGEVSFPGGVCDSNDKTLEQTALRETYEEIGIQSKEVDIWGKGPEINRGDICVTPILGHVKNFNMEKLKINKNEVTLAFPVSLKHLTSPKNLMYTKFRFGKLFTIKTPVYINAEKRIWGLTGYITHLILSSLVPEVYLKNVEFQTSFQKILSAKKKK